MSRSRRAQKRAANKQLNDMQPAPAVANESMKELWALATAAEKRQKLVQKIKLNIKRPLPPIEQPTEPTATKKTKVTNRFVLGKGLSPFVLPTTFKPNIKEGDGFVVVQLGLRKIYISSHEKAEAVAEHFDIPAANQADLSDIADKDLSSDMTVCDQFRSTVKHLNADMDKVLLHCFDGLSRAPLAALVHMAICNEHPQTAKDLVVQSMRRRGGQDYKLDPKGYYPSVLHSLGIEQTRTRVKMNYAE